MAPSKLECRDDRRQRSPTPEELAAYLKEQVEVWGKTAREVGIVPD